MGNSMILEARYVGPVKVLEWGTWFAWQTYNDRRDAETCCERLKRQFKGLYEFRLVKA